MGRTWRGCCAGTQGRHLKGGRAAAVAGGEDAAGGAGEATGSLSGRRGRARTAADGRGHVHVTAAGSIAINGRRLVVAPLSSCCSLPFRLNSKMRDARAQSQIDGPAYCPYQKVLLTPIIVVITAGRYRSGASLI